MTRFPPIISQTIAPQGSATFPAWNVALNHKVL